MNPVETVTYPYVCKYVVERFPANPNENLIAAWQETLTNDALLIREEILHLYIKPKPAWLPKSIWHWAVQHVFLCTSVALDNKSHVDILPGTSCEEGITQCE